MPFALDGNPTQSEISEAINYLLSNFGANITIDQNTGQIVSPGGSIIGYLYKYLAVKYSDSIDGSTNFSDSPTNRLYYGLRNTDNGSESTNPADYVWTKISGGFSTTKFFYYQTNGGRQIQIIVDTTSPGTSWVEDTGLSIDLDIVTGTAVTAGTMAATPAIYIWTTNSTAPARPTTTSTYTWLTGNYSAPVSWSTFTPSDTTPGHYLWKISIPLVASTSTLTSTLDWTDTSYPITAIGSNGSAGTTGNKTATVYLYQWSSSTPGNPTGSSTYTWSPPANSGYTGSNGWVTTVPSNPGTPLVQLWISAQTIVDSGTATTTTVNWTSGYTKYAAGQNGANGASGYQAASPTVYQWALSIPSISGTSTYTWSSGTFASPSGWSTSITTSPSPGYTLWAASVNLTDSATAVSTVINWTLASIIASGYAGATGASSRVMYSRIANNPVPVSGTVTVSGDNRPSGAAGAAVWGSLFNVTWYANDPDPSSNDSLYQSDGIYNGTNTLWSTPYISYLKVGQLSSVSTNTGSLTVTGNFKSNTAAISGTTMTGSGGILYSSGNFAFGNSSTNLAFNGSSMYVNGALINTANINLNQVTIPVTTTATLTSFVNGTITLPYSGPVNIWMAISPTPSAVGPFPNTDVGIGYYTGATFNWINKVTNVNLNSANQIVSIGVYNASAGVPITIYGGAVTGSYYTVILILQGAMR